MKLTSYNDKTTEFDGNYGDRIHLRNPRFSDIVDHEEEAPSQLTRCYELLKKDPSSRRAILTIHNPVWDKVDGDSKDIPCTLNLQFLIRDGKLHCICTMRSNDIWYGTPHNVMMFTFLQRAMAGWLGVQPGDYIHRANSLHMYDKHWEKAASLVDTLGKPGYFREDISPQVFYPTHCQPEVTYAQAAGMIEWEKVFRENVGENAVDRTHCNWRPTDVYEGRVIDFIKEFWAKKLEAQSNESK